jgi:hypothetical protein
MDATKWKSSVIAQSVDLLKKAKEEKMQTQSQTWPAFWREQKDQHEVQIGTIGGVALAAVTFALALVYLGVTPAGFAHHVSPKALVGAFALLSFLDTYTARFFYRRTWSAMWRTTLFVLAAVSLVWVFQVPSLTPAFLIAALAIYPFHRLGQIVPCGYNDRCFASK